MEVRSFAVGLGILLATTSCAPKSQNAEPSPTGISSVSPSPTQSQTNASSPTPSLSPSPTQPATDCGGLKDNSNDPVPSFKESDTIYYLFGCFDNRLVVRVKDGVGQVVHVPLWSEYFYGTISFEGSVPVESVVFSNGVISKYIPTYSGSATDLRAIGYARIVGPTINVEDYFDQDCLDYMQLTGKKDCTNMKTGYADWLQTGDKDSWKNGLPN